MGDRKATLTAVLVDAVSGPARHIRAEISGIGSDAGKVTQVLRGIGQGVGQQLVVGVTEAFRGIADILPSLIGRGHDYLDLLHQVQLETGMSAEQTSTLVGALRALGVPVDDITTLMARLGANIGRNEGLFRQLGVATRDSNGNLLNAYTIFTNVRRAVSEHGESLLSTAAAQELFGRSGFKIIEALQASDPEWKAATDNVRRWGGVVSQAAIAGADKLGDTISSFQQGITDIGVNIAAAIDPYLRAFVDSFASFVQAHLNEIVNFAVGVVNTITGFISGLFGITDSLNVASTEVAAHTGAATSSADNFGKVLKTAAAGSDAFTASINGQIKAIDAHMHALEQASERRRAIRQREQLSQSLSDAQAQLADLRGNAPFTQGLSNAEQQLAIQKHAQDVINAEKDVADKRQALGDFEADQKDRAERELLTRQKDRLQDLLTQRKKADAETLQSGLRMGEGLDKGIGTVLGNLGIKSEEFGKTAKSAFGEGVKAARGFLDILLGTEQSLGPGGLGTFRTGGVIGAIGTLGGAVATLGGVVAAVAGWIGDVVRNLKNILPQFQTDQGPATFLFGAPDPSTAPDWLRKLLHDNGAPGFATGGIVPATPGGRVIRVGEGREDEAIIPLSRLPGATGAGGGNTYHLHFDMLTMPSRDQIREVARQLFDDIDERFYLKAANSPVGIRNR